MKNSSKPISPVPATAAHRGDASSVGQNLRGLVKTMRMKQWIKNVFVLAPLVFDGKLFEPDMLLRALTAVLCFCLASSSVYLLNDLVDIEKDRQHPRKRLRPLPNGQLNPRLAMVSSILFAIAGVAILTTIHLWAGLLVAAYLVLNIAYSFFLKNLVIIDVMMIALFFELRLLTGVVVVDVQNFSPWLYVCTTLLFLFIGFGKRRHEIALLEESAANHRASLEHYNLPFLDQMIGIVTTSALLAYTLYSFEAQTALARDGQMLLTVPFVLYGLFRYLYLIHVRKLGGAPEEMLLQDRPLALSVLLFGISVVAVIYFR
ncbi:MAG: decaprenyl-phosphate phosphoribosyltransferase [Caldilineaceae bacterium]|nr:decaprenyl-phosphate phosphoribosyltransferase [Caldilineaceae bacterium]